MDKYALTLEQKKSAGLLHTLLEVWYLPTNHYGKPALRRKPHVISYFARHFPRYQFEERLSK